MTSRGLFSIGTVSRVVDIPVVTLRNWQGRYGVIVPDRSPGGQRLFAREHVEQLRFVKEQVDAGSTPAEAHRLLAERLDQSGPEPTSASSATTVVARATGAIVPTTPQTNDEGRGRGYT
jgi:DNA-binding transcriptional MerR regulator